MLYLYFHWERLWEILHQAWEKYPVDRIALVFVYHA